MVIGATLEWLDRYVKGDDDVDTGPQFEWVDQRGHVGTRRTTYPVPTATRSSRRRPPAARCRSSRSSAARDRSSACWRWAHRRAARNRFGRKGRQRAEPHDAEVDDDHLRRRCARNSASTYSGIGTASHVYAQLVDDTTGLVLGNLVTPIAVTLDGQSHARPPSIWNRSPRRYGRERRVTVQLVASALPYETINSFGVLNVSSMTLSLPTATGVTATL